MMKIEMLNGSDWVEPTLVESASLVQSANSIGSLTLVLGIGDECSDFADMNTRVRVYDSASRRYEFYGRVIDRSPKMESDGVVSTEYVCEDCVGFLNDTVMQVDSTKSWFNGTSSKYYVEIDEDGTRTISAEDMVEIIVTQHNYTIGDDGGDKWKRISIGVIDASEEITVSAEYEATSYKMLSDIAEDTNSEFRVTYDGSGLTLDFTDSKLGSNAGTMNVGKNISSNSHKDSMAEVVTRMFCLGETYPKLEKKERKAYEVDGALKSGKWKSDSKKKMCRFPVKGALKAVITVGERDEDYAMVFFTDMGISSKKVDILKKYSCTKTSKDNVVREYPVPDDAEYCYVFGSKSSGTKCTTYGYYVNEFGEEINKDFRIGLGFWNKYVDSTKKAKLLSKYGLVFDSTVDKSGTKQYYLQRNIDKYGVVEGTCVKDKLLAVNKITNPKKKVYSVTDLVTGSAAKQKRAKTRAYRFFKYACKQAYKASNHSTEITVDGYDLAAAGIGYGTVKLYDYWNVVNDLTGLDALCEVVRVKRDLLRPWDVTVELGDKAARSSGAGGSSGGGLDGGAAPVDVGDDGDDERDTAITAAAATADAEKASAEALKAIEYAEKVLADCKAAGALADDAYDKVHPITNAMRELLADSEKKAAEATAQVEKSSYIYENQNDLAKCRAEYSQMNSRSAVQWQSVYTASIDAWASEDVSVQAQINSAYGDLYGMTTCASTADGAVVVGVGADGKANAWAKVNDPSNPSEDSAQGHLNAAMEEQVEAEKELLAAESDLSAANKKKATYEQQLASEQAKAERLQAAYDALKKKNKSKKSEVDAAWKAYQESLALQEGLNEKIAQATSDVSDAQAAVTESAGTLAATKVKVANAEAEVDTAMNGIHVAYTSNIQQKASAISEAVSKTYLDGKEYVTEASAQLIVSNAISNITIKGSNRGIFETTDNGFTFDKDEVKGDTGASAYELAVEGGYTGTQAEWLASLKGEDITSEHFRFDATGDHAGANIMSEKDDFTNTHANVKSDGFHVVGYNKSTKKNYDMVSVKEDGLTMANGMSFLSTGADGVFYVSSTLSAKYKFTGSQAWKRFTWSMAKLMEKCGLSGYWKPVAMSQIRTSNYKKVKLSGFNLNPSASGTSAALVVDISREGSKSVGTDLEGVLYIQVFWVKGSSNSVSGDTNTVDISNDAVVEEETGDGSGLTVTVDSFDSANGVLNVTLS